MARTEVRSAQIKDGSIGRDDLNTTTTGQAVALKIVAGTNVSISSTGIDSGTGDVTINASSGSATITEVEVDFGTIPVYNKTFTVTDASVSSSSKIVASQSGAAATGRNADENEMDALTCRGLPGTGSFTLICSSHDGPVVGKYKINYLIG